MWYSVKTYVSLFFFFLNILEGQYRPKPGKQLTLESTFERNIDFDSCSKNPNSFGLKIVAHSVE